MKKLFLFLLIAIGLSSCSGLLFTSSSYDPLYPDYREPNYNPHWIWTDVIYSPYYITKYNNFNFGYSNYYGYYGYRPYYNYYNYYGLYNYNYYGLYNYGLYNYNYYTYKNYKYAHYSKQRKIVHQPRRVRNSTRTSSTIDRSKNYPTRRSSVKQPVNGRTTNRYRYEASPTREKRYTSQTNRSNTAIKRSGGNQIKRTTTPTKTIRTAPTQRGNTSPPVNRGRGTPVKRKN